MATDEPHDNKVFDLEKETLARPTSISIDWGGDGSDLSRPVRAHVLAALQPHAGPYQPPLDKLLTLGEVDAKVVEQFATEHNIGQEHVPELVRMMRDRSLITANNDDPRVMAPFHASLLLKPLNLTAVIPDLLHLLDLDYEIYFDQWSEILGAAGAVALEPTIGYLRDRTRWNMGRGIAISILKQIALQHPEMREQVISVLSELLADTDHEPEQVLTNLMGGLIEIDAVETLPLIRRAFELKKIDEMVYGPWGDILKELGVEPEPDDPLIEESRKRFEQRHRALFPGDLRQKFQAFLEQQEAQRNLAKQQTAAKQRKQAQATKQKNKKKAASAARKANSKKRK